MLIRSLVGTTAVHKGKSKVASLLHFGMNKTIKAPEYYTHTLLRLSALTSLWLLARRFYSLFHVVVNKAACSLYSKVHNNSAHPVVNKTWCAAF
jgi:hypothetical protein